MKQSITFFTKISTLNFRKLVLLLFTLWAALDVSAGVVITIPSTPGTDTTSFTPTNRRFTYSASRMLFTSAEIGSTGTITALGFQKFSGSTSTNVNYISVYMKETTATTVSTTVPSGFPTGYIRVYNSSFIDNTMSSGWTTLTLSTAVGEIMTYAGGSNNLDIILVKTNSETATTTAYPIYNCHTTSGSVSAYYFGSSALGSSFTATTTIRPNIQLTIENTCAGKPAKGTISAPATAVCSATSFTINPTGLTLGTGMRYQWQSRNAGSGAYTNSSATDTFTILTTSHTVNKDYRIVSICSLSGQSDTSSGFTVNVVSPTIITAATDTTFCFGGSVSLSIPTSGGVTYTWFKDGLTTGSIGATYVANTLGTYSVRGSTSSCTGIFSNNKIVTVNPLPTATITTTTATTFCDGLNVVLQANTGTGLTYQWQKAGIDISGETGNSYLATTSGNYRVKVTHTATTCSAFSVVTIVTVNPVPVAPVISGAGGKTSYCSSDNLVLSATPTSGVSYQWESTSGIISGATSNAYTATSPSTYRLNAILGSCSTKSNALVITENPLPIAAITPVGSISFCNSDSLDIKATIGTGVSYQWLESGTPISGAPTTSNYYVTIAGVYGVKVTNTATGCSDKSSTLTVTIISPMMPTITAAGSTTFCVGGSVTINGSVASGLTTEWQESGINIPGEILSTYTAIASGNYRLKVTNGVGCAAYSTPIRVTVNSLPNNSIIVTGGTDICNGTATKIMAPVSTGYTYQWRNAGVDIPGETFNPYYAKTAGIYSVHITDANGCQSTSITTAISVKFVKPFYIHPYGNTFFCDGEKTKLATQSGFTSYQWYLDGVYIPGAIDTFVFATKKGKYSVQVQDPTNSCYATSAGFNILVIPAPDTPFITKVGSRLSTTVKGVNYQWYRDNVAIKGANDSFTMVTKSGVYAVVVINNNDCSKRAEIDLSSTSIDETISKTHYIKVYPNPAQDLLNVEAPAGITVLLTDLQGRVLFQQKEAKVIDMSNFTAGVYILQFMDATMQIIANEKISKVGN